MNIGVVFPQTEIGSDPVGVRDYAQAVEGMGYTHILAYDHVLGAAADGRPPMAYTDKTMFHEPFVLFGYLAGITKTVELATGILILPQRQTALVAKQAIEIDVLTGGRLRLGVGIGWNPVEYEALGENFKNRGRRIEEQVEVIRKLTSEPLVDYRGRYHTIDRAGLNPLPSRRPIPIWFGGSAEAAIQRIARIADGWMPNRKPPEGWAAVVAQVREWVREGGRDPSTFGIEGRINTANVSPDAWRADAEEWRQLGANYLDVNTMGAGLQGPQAHVDRLRQIKAAIGAG
jgi:probable F420-dependent oxidoreductase